MIDFYKKCYIVLNINKLHLYFLHLSVTLEEMKQLEQDAEKYTESLNIFRDPIKSPTEKARQAKEILSQVRRITLQDIGKFTLLFFVKIQWKN